MAIFPTSPFGKSSELCVLLFIGTKAVFLWQYFHPQQPFGMNYDLDLELFIDKSSELDFYYQAQDILILTVWHETAKIPSVIRLQHQI